jgi:hypothetical protein
MNESLQNVVTATTETDRGKRDFWSKSVPAWAGGCVFIAFAVGIFFQPGDAWVRGLLQVMAVLAGIACFVIPVFQLQQRGEWKLDRDGILFTPLRGKPRYLAWCDIDAVRLPSQATPMRFRARKVQIVFCPAVENQDHRDRIQQLLNAVLSHAFDLTKRPPAPFSLRRVLLGTVVALPFALLPLAGALVQGIYLDPANRCGKWGMLWIMGWLIPMMVASYRIVKQEDRRWWRLRLSSKQT